MVATCYLLGVSTRRMDKLVETLGITHWSKSQVSVVAKELDTAVEAFRTRPLDAGPYTFVAADALDLKVREGGRVVTTCGQFPCPPTGSFSCPLTTMRRQREHRLAVGADPTRRTRRPIPT